MKRIGMMMFAVVLIASFAACSQTKKGENEVKDAVESAAVETTQVVEEMKQEAVPEDVKPDEAIKAFQAFAKEYGEAFNNITKDPAKFSALAGQLAEKVAAMEKIKSGFSKKQAADYQSARDLINKVNTAGEKK
jgi:hypothetical protein